MLSLLPLLAAPLAAQQRPATLDTVRVEVASRAAPQLAAAGRAVEVVDRAAIDRLPARTLADVLARALGVEVLGRSPASADLAIRGSSFEQVVVLVDGVRVSDDQTGHFDLDLAVPLEAVERVEILRGAGAALYGSDAVGGVVNVVTRGARGTRARVQGGSFGTASAALAHAGRAGATGLQASADLLRSDGHRPGTDYDVLQARLAAERTTAAGLLRADVGAARRDFGAADFYGAYPSHERTGAVTAALRLESVPAARVRTSLTTGARQHTDRFTLWRDQPARYQNRHETWQLEAEAVARVDAGRAALAVGASGHRSQLRSARLGDRHEERAALFGEAAVGDADGARVTAGLRGDWTSRFGVYASPSLALSLPAGDALRLRANAVRGFRTPTWTERYYQDPANVGSPDLGAETFWSGEAGATWARGGVRADVAAFVREARGLIDWARPLPVVSGAPWRTLNVEQATFRGVELLLEASHLAGAHWTLRASGLDVDADAAEGYAGKYALRPVTRAASLAVERPLVARLTAAAELSHGRRLGEEAWERADLRLSWHAGAARMDIDLVNLGAADYLDAAGKPVMGRAVFAGVSWRR